MAGMQKIIHSNTECLIKNHQWEEGLATQWLKKECEEQRKKQTDVIDNTDTETERQWELRKTWSRN